MGGLLTKFVALANKVRENWETVQLVFGLRSRPAINVVDHASWMTMFSEPFAMRLMPTTVRNLIATGDERVLRCAVFVWDSVQRQ